MNRSTKKHPGGYKALTDAFSSQFADHLPDFQETLNKINDSLDGPKLPKVKFDGADVELFASQAIGTKNLLNDVLDITANAAKRQALFNVGGLKFSDLAGELAKQFGKTKAQAKSLADTGISVFYRTIASQTYKKIEKVQGRKLLFEYAGPDDSLTRDFCDYMLAKTKEQPMTRAEIDDEDNGQGLPVFVSCGGFNCRHSLILASGDPFAAQA